MLLTIDLSCLSNELTNKDLPTLGLPTMATLIISSSTVSSNEKFRFELYNQANPV